MNGRLATLSGPGAVLHLDDFALSEELQEPFKESTTKSALLSINRTVPKTIQVRAALKTPVSAFRPGRQPRVEHAPEELGGRCVVRQVDVVEQVAAVPAFRDRRYRPALHVQELAHGTGRRPGRLEIIECGRGPARPDRVDLHLQPATRKDVVVGL